MVGNGYVLVHGRYVVMDAGYHKMEAIFQKMRDMYGVVDGGYVLEMRGGFVNGDGYGDGRILLAEGGAGVYDGREVFILMGSELLKLMKSAHWLLLLLTNSR